MTKHKLANEMIISNGTRRSWKYRLRDLLLRGLAGDAAAYHDFLKELSAHLRAFLKRRLASLPDDVEDLVQETLLAVHNQRHTYAADQPLTAWVCFGRKTIAKKTSRINAKIPPTRIEPV